MLQVGREPPRRLNFVAWSKSVLRQRCDVTKSASIISNLLQIFHLDLGNLIGKTQCWNFRNLLPIRFYVNSTLVILKPKNCHFDHLSTYEVWIFENLWHFQVWNFSKYQYSKPPKLLKWLFLTFQNQSKLISSKIRVPGKSLDSYTVKYPQSKIPIWLPRSVEILKISTVE